MSRPIAQIQCHFILNLTNVVGSGSFYYYPGSLVAALSKWILVSHYMLLGILMLSLLFFFSIGLQGWATLSCFSQNFILSFCFTGEGSIVDRNESYNHCNEFKFIAFNRKPIASLFDSILCGWLAFFGSVGWNRYILACCSNFIIATLFFIAASIFAIIVYSLTPFLAMRLYYNPVWDFVMVFINLISEPLNTLRKALVFL